jgi:ABC-type polysaccharide/polyol phosphate transport system ATPase subunit
LEETAIDRPESPGPDAPLAIEARGLEKTFRIPTHRVDSLKERIVRPFSAGDARVLRALDGISFDVRQGEFFGIVGRNGSGKSTLLKLLASIYRPDAGTIRMAGRLAPFIELGVGFNPELTARENVVLNGVMMGLTPGETRRRLDAVIEFAELEEFANLKLKNYSSGMLVRLAFSVMVQADADVLLIDEVLAVGDAAFQQKCADVFHEMKAAGKTIVLVTHEMGTVEAYCHRAMLIDSGDIRMSGDPAEIGREYLRLNFERGSADAGTSIPSHSDEVKLAEVWVEDSTGQRQTTVEAGVEIHLRADLEILQDVEELGLGVILANADGLGIAEVGTAVEGEDEKGRIRAGRHVHIDLHLENNLVPGRYFVHLGVSRIGTANTSLYVHNAADFVVFGTGHPRGIVSIPHRFETAVLEKGQP